jgi:8-oxo-dGTP pyrophosphatase MutT (NUDIX family)
MQSPISAVRIIVADQEGHVLIVKRQMTQHGEGAWCLPGGKVDYGDRVDDSVSKELREETSLACTSAKFLFYQDSLPYEPEGMHCVNLYFECEVSGEIALNEESSEYAWIGPDELERYDIAFRNDLGLMRYWQERASSPPPGPAAQP